MSMGNYLNAWENSVPCCILPSNMSVYCPFMFRLMKFNWDLLLFFLYFLFLFFLYIVPLPVTINHIIIKAYPASISHFTSGQLWAITLTWTQHTDPTLGTMVDNDKMPQANGVVPTSKTFWFTSAACFVKYRYDINRSATYLPCMIYYTS